jgi:hypothetical protein
MDPFSCIIIHPEYCLSCKHFDGPIEKGKKIGCLAFPNGIPTAIVEGTMRHDSIVKGQKGNYVYKE